jgi:hypothetical protein
MQINTSSAAKKKSPRKMPEITLFKDDNANSKALVGDTIIKVRHISPENAEVISAFSEIYARQFNNEVVDLERQSNEYLGVLQKLWTESVKADFNNMVNLWTIFDALHLSRNKSQMIRKILQTILAQ